MPQSKRHGEQTRDPQSSLGDQFRNTRALTQALASPLSDADASLQSMADASPTKWHLAHTTWFWETFVLRDHAKDYRLHDEQWPFLFNSYYEAEGERIFRGARGMLSRPSLDQIMEWRAAVDSAMLPMLDDPELADIIALGIAHEQQHIELLLTDIKHALFQNPLGPAIWAQPVSQPRLEVATQWYEHPGGIALIGHDTHEGGAGFAFDNEGPRHRVLLEPFALAPQLVTNRQWDEFIADGGYQTPSLWLSDGLAWVRENAILAPLYWREHEGRSEHFTHSGWQERDPDSPVTHISYYEADAFASWAGARLPTEFEWEAIAHSDDPSAGHQCDHASPPLPRGGSSLFGDCWQFTRSAYLPYPGFKPPGGAVGEYNGKFMSGQCVLKGASCATVRGHSRATYRNFFYPHQRWQFTGLRLAKDV